jgi:hypothetical protein
MILLVAAVALPAAAGCLDRELAPLNPCVVSGVVESVKASNIEKVDLLFMVDNSNSMREEQQALAEQFPRLVSVLASGDRDADGTQDFPPVRDLNVGVITSDMGTGQFSVGGVCEAGLGDDGILRDTPGNADALDRSQCQDTYNPPFLNFQPDRDGIDQVPAFADDFECLALLGTGGCGFEQQLEATLKALTPSTSDITFQNGTVGHGDGANDGFLRPDSLLAMVLVTDEDDCSAENPELFNPNPDNAQFPGNINLRCFQYPDAVHPVSRYVDGFLALRDDPDLLIYSAITGVPTRLVSDPSSVNFQEILDAPEMQEMVDPDNPQRLATSCNTAFGVAFPPRRIVRVAQDLEAAESNAVITSICQQDFTPALNAIIDKIADVLGGSCLPRDLNPDSQGLVNCSVVETLPNPDEAQGDQPTSCEDLRELGRRPFNCPPNVALDDCYDSMNIAPRIDEETGGEVCVVDQISRQRLEFNAEGRCAAPMDADGWFYDDCSTDVRESCSMDGQRIAFTPGDEPKTGVLVNLECLQTVEGSDTGTMERGTPCDPSMSMVCTDAQAQNICCEANQNEWQVRCTSNADCNEANLGGFVCPTMDQAEMLGLSTQVCVNPTCDQ